MTPFAKPIAATYSPTRFGNENREGVAIIATNDDEFLAVDQRGEIIQGEHHLFNITDWDVNQTARDFGS